MGSALKCLSVSVSLKWGWTGGAKCRDHTTTGGGLHTSPSPCSWGPGLGRRHGVAVGPTPSSSLLWEQVRPHRMTGRSKLGGTQGDHRVQLLLRTRQGTHCVPESVHQTLLELCQASAVSPSLERPSRCPTPPARAFPDIQHLPRPMGLVPPRRPAPGRGFRRRRRAHV